MIKNEKTLDNKVTVYIDTLFTGVGPTQQLFDLKEELATNIKEKIADFKSRGMGEEQAFKEAVISMGDLGGLVDDLRKLGQEEAKQSVYSTMTTRISTGGIVAGVLLVLFGLFVSTMMYFMGMEDLVVAANGIFIVAGGALITYSIFTRETMKRFGMNKIRAALYALSVGLLLFGLYVSAVTYFATGEKFISTASLMVFFLSGIGLCLLLILTETDRRKQGHN